MGTYENSIVQPENVHAERTRIRNLRPGVVLRPVIKLPKFFKNHRCVGGLQKNIFKLIYITHLTKLL